MFRRRIEITREHWTRILFDGACTPLCPTCRHAPELVTVSEAAVRSCIPAEDIEAAIASNLIPSLGGEGLRLVCLHCLNTIQKDL